MTTRQLAPQCATPAAPRPGPPRPGPLRWLGYAFGAGLPQRYDEWVLHDTTCRSWLWRHLLRAMVQLSVPIAAVCLLLPGPAWIRVTIVIAGSFMSMIFSFGYVTETSDHRLVKAGYPTGMGDRYRKSRAVSNQNEDNARRRERIAARKARRRG